MDYIITKQNEKNITLVLHPYIYAYFTTGAISKRTKWFFKYFRWVKLRTDSSLGLTEFKFLDEVSQNIDMESEATLEDYRNEEYITSEK